MIEAGGPEENPWWGMALTVRATALLQLGRYQEARSDLLEAVSQMHTIPGFEAGALLLVAWLHLRDGDLAAAVSYADAGRRIADRHELAHVVPLLVVYSTDALIAARTGDIDRALGASTSSTRRSPASARPHPAPASSATNSSPRPSTRSRTASRPGGTSTRPAGCTPAPALPRPRRRARPGRTLLAHGPAGSNLAITPLTAAERHVLPLLATHLTLPEIATELTVSRNTVKTHCVALYRKLGVSSRSDAVTEARRLGLIGG